MCNPHARPNTRNCPLHLQSHASQPLLVPTYCLHSCTTLANCAFVCCAMVMSVVSSLNSFFCFLCPCVFICLCVLCCTVLRTQCCDRQSAGMASGRESSSLTFCLHSAEIKGCFGYDLMTIYLYICNSIHCTIMIFIVAYILVYIIILFL